MIISTNRTEKVARFAAHAYHACAVVVTSPAPVTTATRSCNTTSFAGGDAEERQEEVGQERQGEEIRQR